MHTVQGFLILVRVALLASGIGREGEVAKVVGSHRGVDPGLEITMAGGAQELAPMNTGCVGFLIHVEREHFSTGKGDVQV